MDVSCPICSTKNNLEYIQKEKEVLIRNEPINLTLNYYECNKCGKEFLIPDKDNDPFIGAYRLYREKYGMIQPEEIYKFRRKYGFTQSELSTLLGFGGATISRYESGSLQDEAHDKALKYTMDINNLKDIIMNSVNVFPDAKKEKVLGLIEKEIGPEEKVIERFILGNLAKYEADEYSGGKEFDYSKFVNTVLYYCQEKEGVVKTKLNKLLFYGVSITGSKYAHITFGPAPDNYDLYYSLLLRQKIIQLEEFNQGRYSGEAIVATKKSDLSIFTDGELRILTTVKEQFSNHSATRITRESHQEKAFLETKDGQIISYKYAKDLKY